MSQTEDLSTPSPDSQPSLSSVVNDRLYDGLQDIRDELSDRQFGDLLIATKQAFHIHKKKQTDLEGYEQTWLEATEDEHNAMIELASAAALAYVEGDMTIEDDVQRQVFARMVALGLGFTNTSIMPCPPVHVIAEAAYEANRHFCELIGEEPYPAWGDYPDNMKGCILAGVEFHTQNPEVDASASHDSWLAHKESDGWVYGETKDPEAKTHPCMVPYESLPAEQQAKDYIFMAVVERMMGDEQTVITLVPEALASVVGHMNEAVKTGLLTVGITEVQEGYFSAASVLPPQPARGDSAASITEYDKIKDEELLPSSLDEVADGLEPVDGVTADNYKEKLGISLDAPTLLPRGNRVVMAFPPAPQSFLDLPYAVRQVIFNRASNCNGYRVPVLPRMRGVFGQEHSTKYDIPTRTQPRTVDPLEIEVRISVAAASREESLIQHDRLQTRLNSLRKEAKSIKTLYDSMSEALREAMVEASTSGQKVAKNAIAEKRGYMADLREKHGFVKAAIAEIETALHVAKQACSMDVVQYSLFVNVDTLATRVVFPDAPV